MKLSKTTECSLIPIKFPRWKERAVGLPTYKIKTHNEITIEYTKTDGTKLYPYPLYITGEKAKQYPLQHLKNGVSVHIVPIKDLEVLERV